VPNSDITHEKLIIDLVKSRIMTLDSSYQLA
jgi:hypothetical protein